jgi:HK97 family phage portal protein
MIADLIFGDKLSNYQNPEPWFTHLFGGDESASGERVNETNALTLSAVWAATRFLTSTIASFPCILYKEQADGDRDRDTENPLYPLLKDAPSPGFDAFLWWEMEIAWLINWGNAFAEIGTDPFGGIRALWPIHPSRMRIDQTLGNVSYFVRNDDGSESPIPAERMLNIVGPLSDDGIVGKGVIRQARESIGMGMATEKYGARFFGNDARPGSLLIHPQKLSEDAQEKIRSAWTRRFTGKGARSPAILAEDMKYQQLGIPPEDGQFLETRQFNVTDIARWYNLPPHVLGDLTRATFSNIEQQGIDLVVHSLRPWCVRIEKALKRQLLPEGTADQYWEFLVDALLRGDRKSRQEALQIQFMNGALTLDDWCRIENLPRPEGEQGKTRFVPVNLVPIEIALNPPEPAPAAAPGGKKPQQPSGGKPLAVRTLWDREWARLTLIESKELRRLAKTPGTFLNRWSDFLTEHERAIASAIEPIMSCFPEAFSPLLRLASEFARLEIEWLGQMVANTAECQPADLADRVESFINHKLQPRRTWEATWPN